MKYLKFILAGIVFGILMTKAQIISWYRIYEMFRFESFHMYGIIGSAVVLGVIGTALIKKYKLKSIAGNPIEFKPKEKRNTAGILGGICFGLGWGLIGACPGPMFVLLGAGFYSILVVIAGALLGTFVYGILRKQLPH